MSSPVGLPGIVAAWLGVVVFAALMIIARAGRGREDRATTTVSTISLTGIIIQAVGIGSAAAGPSHAVLHPLSAQAVLEGVLVALLMAAADALFFWSSRTMGRNWAIIARTRVDHALVTAGPFRIVRHPIYVAFFLMLLAFAVAFGHLARLPIAVPLYALGTWLRIREEERLLRTMFGADYDGYAARVKRFVPRVF